MNKFVGLIAVACVLQVASAAVARDSPAPLLLTDLAKQAEDVFGKLHSQILQTIGVKNNNDIIKLLESQGRTYATKMQNYAKLIGDEAKANAGKTDKLFQGLQARLTSTVEELRTKGPETFASVEKFQAHLKAVLKETELFNAKLREEGQVISSNVEDVVKQIYDSTVQTAKKIYVDIEATAKAKKV